MSIEHSATVDQVLAGLRAAGAIHAVNSINLAMLIARTVHALPPDAWVYECDAREFVHNECNFIATPAALAVTEFMPRHKDTREWVIVLDSRIETLGEADAMSVIARQVAVALLAQHAFPRRLTVPGIDKSAAQIVEDWGFTGRGTQWANT